MLAPIRAASVPAGEPMPEPEPGADYNAVRRRSRPRPISAEASSVSVAGSGTVLPPGLLTPVVPISRHCSDSLQLPELSAELGTEPS